jgi:hypothetical protein
MIHTDPLEEALFQAHLDAGAARATRTQDLPPIQGARANDPFNRSLDLTVKDTPSGKAPEPADLPAWKQPLAMTKEGMNSGELVRQGSGMIHNSLSSGDGKVGQATALPAESETAEANQRRVNEWQTPLAMTKGK